MVENQSKSTEVCHNACSPKAKPSLNFPRAIQLVRIALERFLERAGILKHDNSRDLMQIINGSRMDRYRAAKHIHHMQKGTPDTGYKMPMPRHPNKR